MKRYVMMPMSPGVILASLITCLGLLLSSCGGGGQASDKKQAEQKTTQPVPGEKECYNYMAGGDTVVLTLKWLDSNRFTGSLMYSLKEKDRNVGSLEGQLKDSILLADYQFNAEGMTSTREVAFKKIADYIVEGYGDVTPDSSGFRFTHPDSLSFDLNRKYQKVNCL